MHQTAAFSSPKTHVQNSPRTVILGLDSIDLLLVERWVSEGHLPFFRKMIETTPLVTLQTPSRVLQGAVWPSLLTGASPGRHGLFLQSQLKNGTYDVVDNRPDYRSLKRFYQHLGEAGVRCGVADIPIDQPDPGLNGVQVIEWATEFRFWGKFETQPPTLRREIISRIGKHPLTHWKTGESQSSHIKLTKKMAQGVRKKAALGHYLIERNDLDLVFFIFGEAHKTGHFLWKYWDLQHPDHENCDPRLHNALLDNYRQIDHELAQLTDMVGPEDNLLVLSDHGMQANYRGDHLIEPILVQLGLLAYKGLAGHQQTKNNKNKIEGGLTKQLLRYCRNTSRKLVPGFVKPALSRILPNAHDVDWKRTRAFVLPTDRNTYIRINLRDREPDGQVEPGADYEALLDKIESEIRALINPATGSPAVEDVFRLHALYPGDRVEDLPDLSILWCADAPIDAVTSPTLGTIKKRIRERRSGNHRAEGFLLARGPSFRPGAGRFEGDILQIAPTLLHLHGIPIPTQYEMSPLSNILFTNRDIKEGEI